MTTEVRAPESCAYPDRHRRSGSTSLQPIVLIRDRPTSLLVSVLRAPRTEFSSASLSFLNPVRASAARTGSIDHHRAGLLRSITKAEVAQDHDFITSGIIINAAL